MKTKWYLHNSHNTFEIVEQLEDWGVDLPAEEMEHLAKEIHDKFYEIEFDVTFDKKGNITNLELTKK